MKERWAIREIREAINYTHLARRHVSDPEVQDKLILAEEMLNGALEKLVEEGRG